MLWIFQILHFSLFLSSFKTINWKDFYNVLEANMICKHNMLHISAQNYVILLNRYITDHMSLKNNFAH